MRRSVLTIALASLCGLAVASAVSRAPGVVAQATDRAPTSRVEGDQVMDNAVATAVIAAIGRQFGEERAAVRLDQIDVKPASIRDRTVAGFGRLQLGPDAAWIPFRFEALYDTESTAVSYPRLVLGEAQPGNELEASSDIARALAQRVDRALSDEFAQQPFELVIDRVATSKAGQRLMQVRGTGTVDFGAEGATAAQIDALYDPVEARWLRVDYELGTTANWDVEPGAALAGR
jgi:hypothetical protein